MAGQVTALAWTDDGWLLLGTQTGQIYELRDIALAPTDLFPLRVFTTKLPVIDIPVRGTLRSAIASFAFSSGELGSNFDAKDTVPLVAMGNRYEIVAMRSTPDDNPTQQMPLRASSPSVFDTIVAQDAAGQRAMATVPAGGSITALAHAGTGDRFLVGFADGHASTLEPPETSLHTIWQGDRQSSVLKIVGAGDRVALATTGARRELVFLTPGATGSAAQRFAYPGVVFDSLELTSSGMALLRKVGGGIILRTPDREVDLGRFATLPTTAAALSPAGDLFAVATGDGTIAVASIVSRSDGSLRAADGFDIRGHRDAVTHLAFSPDGKRLASAGLDGRLFVTNIAFARHLYGWPLARLPAGPSIAEMTPLPLDKRSDASGSETPAQPDASGATPAATANADGASQQAPADAGRFLVVFGGDQTLAAAQDEIARARKAGFTNLRILKRENSFRSVALFTSAAAQAEALPLLRGLSPDAKDAYGRTLDAWCVAPNMTQTVVDCVAPQTSAAPAATAKDAPPATANDAPSAKTNDTPPATANDTPPTKANDTPSGASQAPASATTGKGAPSKAARSKAGPKSPASSATQKAPAATD